MSERIKQVQPKRPTLWHAFALCRAAAAWVGLGLGLVRFNVPLDT